jgi:3D (Asp-Asp-Asp) domain-containing protein
MPLMRAVVAIMVAALIYNPTQAQANQKVSHYCCAPKSNTLLHQHHRPRPQSLARNILNHSFLARLENLGVFRLTSYTGGDPSQGTGTRTSLGTRAAYGQIAVDTRVIPLGSYIYIPGYGLARATDRGGAVNGNHIDLCFGIGGPGTAAYNRALNWGTRYGNIYVVPKELVGLFR